MKDDRLYNLLPAVYRQRDAAEGEPLHALLAVIENELRAIEADIDSLYENWFIETCEEWVVPYIGDLLGVRGLHAGSPGTFSLRAYVANTLAYRRRKGTATMLEQLARDVTGWPARVVEFSQLLSTTQHLNHLRLANLSTPDLRDTNQLELLGSPFERAARTADVRRIVTNRGKYNVPNVGVFLWRLQSYTLTRLTPRAVTEPADGRYTFHPLGLDAPLFNRPQTETEMTHLAEEVNVPGILRRRPLYEELEARRQALVDDKTPRAIYFGSPPVLQVFVTDPSDPIPPEEILICDLSRWDSENWRPPPSKTYERSDKTTFQTKVAVDLKVAVDPELGRLAFLADLTPPGQVQVTYTCAFSGDVGGGPYNRRDSVSRALTRPVDWQVGVSRKLEPTGDELALTEAVQEWNTQPAGKVGVIVILDSHTYSGDLKIIIPEGSQLMIVALDGHRPHVIGNLKVEGKAKINPGELVLNGLLIEGVLTIHPGNLGRLQVGHCTLVPDKGGLEVKFSNHQLNISLERSICGPIVLPDTVPALRIVDSIVDKAGGEAAVRAPGTALDLQTSTVFGNVNVRSLEAGNSILTEKVTAVRRQVGCVRFCYVPQGAQIPRQYRCQPLLALTQRAKELGLDSIDDLPPDEKELILAMRPAFTSTHYGQPAYAQLSVNCAEQIRTGAEDGSEMGVFSFLKQPQRETNLRASLDEYLRFGLEAGLFYVT